MPHKHVVIWEYILHTHKHTYFIFTIITILKVLVMTYPKKSLQCYILIYKKNEPILDQFITSHQNYWK